jgi:hypothetical protein
MKIGITKGVETVEKAQLNVEIPKWLKSQLDVYAAKMDEKLKTIVEKAIIAYIHGE